LKDEVPQDVAERPYERWVMRAAELVHGDYPEDRWEAARLLLARMRDRFVDNVSPNAFWREGESTLEELPSVSVRGISLEVECARVDLTVDPNSLVCQDASVLHALAPALLPDKNAEIVLYCWDAA